MERQIFLRRFHEKLLEGSALAIFFADFSEKFIKNLSLFIGDLIPNSRFNPQESFMKFLICFALAFSVISFCEKGECPCPHATPDYNAIP